MTERHPVAPLRVHTHLRTHAAFSSGSHISLGEISKLNPLVSIPNVLCPVYYKIYNVRLFTVDPMTFLKGKKKPTYEKKVILNAAQVSMTLCREPHHSLCGASCT